MPGRFVLAIHAALFLVVATGPAGAAEIATHRSEHVVLTTDVGKEEAEKQLARLEQHLGHIAEYWGKPPQGKIECFLVQNLADWPEDALHEHGREAIERGLGTTLSFTVGSGGRRQARAPVYASAAGTSLFHEVVHAYCRQTFFEVGPLWYAEGMAEVGQYWRADKPGVNCEDDLAPNLRRVEPWTIEQIVAAEARSEETYGWSWTLCELMTNNPNYADMFKKFGRELLAGKQLDFVKHFEKDLDRIRFEHRLLAAQFGPGYRADLCAWDWKTQFGPPTRETQELAVDAARGWQATGLLLQRGQRVACKASGQWRTSEDGPTVSADGAADNRGKLIGVLLNGYDLCEPFPLGRSGNLESPGDGNLYVRCYDEWNQLGDNEGTITLSLPKPEGVEVVASTTPGNNPPKQPRPSKPATPVDAEKRAAAKLRLAKVFLESDVSAAQRRLQEVIDEFPGTKAAAEAEELLKR